MTESEYLRCPRCGQTERREVVKLMIHDYRCSGVDPNLGQFGQACRVGLADYEEIPPPNEAEEMRALLMRVPSLTGGWIRHGPSEFATLLRDVDAFLSRDTGEG
ncbi:MAG: hypothetical protein V3V08_05640 [Nannocystaceae bacterium]